MGVLPLVSSPKGSRPRAWGLSGHETFDLVTGVRGDLRRRLVRDRSAAMTGDRPEATDGTEVDLRGRACRIDTPEEAQYYRHGGILHYVLRRLAAS